MGNPSDLLSRLAPEERERLAALVGQACYARELEKATKKYLNSAPAERIPDRAPTTIASDETRPAAESIPSTLEYALAYAALSWPVLPIKPGTKSPLGGKGIKHATTDEKTIRDWWGRWPSAGMAVYLAGAGLCAIDIDPRNGTTKTSTDFPATLTAWTGGGGSHLIYRAPAGVTLPGKLEPGVDLKHDGYILLAPSMHPSGGQYVWDEFDPRDAALVGPPAIADFPMYLLPEQAPVSRAAVPSDLDAAIAEAIDEATIMELRSALAMIPSDDRDTWQRMGHALRTLGDKGREIWEEWSRRSSKYDATDAEHKWCSFRPTRTGYAAVFAEAQRRGWVNPKTAPTSSAVPAPATEPRTAASLLAMSFDSIKWTIQRILPEGVYLLVAAPKIGKSWLALQMGLAIAGAGEVLGQKAEVGSVLYLALEDSDRRMHSRLRKHDADFVLDAQSLARFHYVTQWPRVDADGGAALEEWLKAHPDARLVVVDVLERFRAPRSPKGNLYSEDYAAMRVIKTLADKFRISVLVVHHTRKGDAEDPLETISGTQGLAGAADGVLVLRRPRGAERGELHIVGRDLEDEGEYVVEFRRATCRWEMVGSASQVAPTVERQAILNALHEAGGPMRLSQVASSVKRTPSATSNLLRKLVESGQVTYAVGNYSIRDHGPPYLRRPVR